MPALPSSFRSKIASANYERNYDLMYLVLFGPPGSGKGTQALQLAKQSGVVHISTGDILRDAVQKKSLLGVEAENYLKHGQLVPDELVVAIVQERIGQEDCKKGFILDGFPRTVSQAESLDRFLNGKKDELVSVFINLSDEICVARLSQRKTCSKCRLTYNAVTRPPKKEGFCDDCHTELVLREDDRPETVKKRLKVYREQTAPLINYYDQTHRLVRIDGSFSTEIVFKNLIDLV